jgi:hypothetical protein
MGKRRQADMVRPTMGCALVDGPVHDRCPLYYLARFDLCSAKRSRGRVGHRAFLGDSRCVAHIRFEDGGKGKLRNVLDHCLAFFGFWWWRARRASERAAELAPTGMLRSPLYWVPNALGSPSDSTGAVYSPHSPSIAGPRIPLVHRFCDHRGSALRRALKWRYPV